MMEAPGRYHYNYDQLDQCTCRLCARHRMLMQRVRRLRKVNANDSVWLADEQITHADRGFLVLYNRYLASANKRDLYCEASYLTRGKKWAPVFLAWLLARIEDPNWQTVGWWVAKAEGKTLGSWIGDWRDETAAPPPPAPCAPPPKPQPWQPWLRPRLAA